MSFPLQGSSCRSNRAVMQAGHSKHIRTEAMVRNLARRYAKRCELVPRSQHAGSRMRVQASNLITEGGIKWPGQRHAMNQTTDLEWARVLA